MAARDSRISKGDCWLIETSGARLQPLGLPNEFMVDGLDVAFTTRDAPNVLTACPSGTPKYVEQIRRR